MGIFIKKNTKIYVVSPALAKTGGPELLHQFAFNLRNKLNIEAYMYYIPNNISDPVNNEYKEYNIPFVREIEDNPENIIIVPEVYSYVKFLKNFKNIGKILWWLSVDNFYISLFFEEKYIYQIVLRIINKLFKVLTKQPLFDIPQLIMKYYNNKDFTYVYNFLKDINLHLVQSKYAENHLRKLGIINIDYLSDYLNTNFLLQDFDIDKKENIVLYNPSKGYYFTYKIIKNAPNLKFIPIKNLSRNMVIELLKKSKVYIDFGNHPGKDRLPREAAILGCCVITGKRGSAAFFEDVPIPYEYKFEDRIENIPKIIKKIEECLEKYEEKYKDFDYYRSVIKNEPKKFEEDLKKIFIKL
jgi:hypothetical protein